MNPALVNTVVIVIVVGLFELALRDVIRRK